jgi:hypothetical protein
MKKDDPRNGTKHKLLVTGYGLKEVMGTQGEFEVQEGELD